MIKLTTICYNEEKILPYFLDYYSTFCDKIIVYDNESTDNSLDIIRRYPNAEIRSNCTNGEISDLRYLEIKNHSWKDTRSLYDWQIVVDIDEFIYFEGNILDELEIYKKSRINIIPTIGYSMLADEYPTDYNKSIFEQIQYGVPTRQYGKPAIFNPNEIGEIYYRPGAHICEPKGNICLGWATFKLLHYKFFGYQNWVNRNNLYTSRIGPNADGHAVAYQDWQTRITTEEEFNIEFGYNNRKKII